MKLENLKLVLTACAELQRLNETIKALDDFEARDVAVMYGGRENKGTEWRIEANVEQSSEVRDLAREIAGKQRLATLELLKSLGVEE